MYLLTTLTAALFTKADGSVNNGLLTGLNARQTSKSCFQTFMA